MGFGNPGVALHRHLLLKYIISALRQLWADHALTVGGRFSRRLSLTALDHKYITYTTRRNECFPRKSLSVEDSAGVDSTQGDAVAVLLLAHLFIPGTSNKKGKNVRTFWSHACAVIGPTEIQQLSKV